MDRRGRRDEDPPDESLGILLLPGKLEGFELEAHARDLLSIPRVVALEPSSVRAPRFLRDAASLRQARRLKFPGRPRLVVLYHPAQYPLARALLGHYEELELWYVAPDRVTLAAAGGQASAEELLESDELARVNARHVVAVVGDADVQDGPLRLRLRELEVISPRAFVPVVPSRRSRRL
ncbi:MAG TPA: hypothetical protein VGL51_01805 [Solirubrobacteraceae bacterium]|jgi:hypothetical protein